MTHDEILEIARDRWDHKYEVESVKAESSTQVVNLYYYANDGSRSFYEPFDPTHNIAQAADLVVHYRLAILPYNYNDRLGWWFQDNGQHLSSAWFATWQLAVCAGALAKVREKKDVYKMGSQTLRP